MFGSAQLRALYCTSFPFLLVRDGDDRDAKSSFHVTHPILGKNTWLHPWLHSAVSYSGTKVNGARVISFTIYFLHSLVFISDSRSNSQGLVVNTTLAVHWHKHICSLRFTQLREGAVIIPTGRQARNQLGTPTGWRVFWEGPKFLNYVQ